MGEEEKKWYEKISMCLPIVILLVLVLSILSCFLFGRGFIKNPLILPGVLFIFVLFDFSIFLFNSHIDHAENQKNSEPLKYYPNLKLWGIGFILGLAVFIFGYFEPRKDVLLGKKEILIDKSEIVMGKDMVILDSRVSSMELIQQIAILLFFLAVLGIILAAIVKIVRDE